MSWISQIMPSKIRTEGGSRHSVPEGVWSKCTNCNAVLYSAELERNLHVCPKCSEHRRLSARQRIDSFLDPQQRTEIASEVSPVDPLRFKDSKRYKDRLAQAQKDSGENDALVVVQGQLHGMPVLVCAFDFNFMGGSMGSVVGEKFVRGANAALGNSIPMICFAASGGARMQEGLLSLMQMSKTSAALSKLSERGIPYISVLTNPTMGGVAASLAMLGDVNIAEPKALIGFAGPRVIEQTVRQTLPEGFQTSEFLLQHGAIDMIVDRREMREEVHRILSMLTQQPGLNASQSKTSSETTQT